MTSKTDILAPTMNYLKSKARTADKALSANELADPLGFTVGAVSSCLSSHYRNAQRTHLRRVKNIYGKWGYWYATKQAKPQRAPQRKPATKRTPTLQLAAPAVLNGPRIVIPAGATTITLTPTEARVAYQQMKLLFEGGQ